MMSDTCLICPRNLIKVWCSENSNIDTYDLQFQQQIIVNHTRETEQNRNFSCGALIWHEMGTGKTLTGLHYLRQKKFYRFFVNHRCRTNSTCWTA